MKRPPLSGTLKLLYWEAAFAMAYEAWVGLGWLSGLAGEVGISVQGMTLLAALPWVGFTGQLIALIVFRPKSSVRLRTLRLAWIARLLWVVPLLIAALLGYRSYRDGVPFPREPYFLFLATVALLVSALAQSSAVSWMSWMRGLIRGEIRGRFFGQRQRATMIAIIVANLLGAALVSWKPDGWLLGYGTLGALAVISAIVSTLLLSRVPDLSPHMSAEPIAPIVVHSPQGQRISDPPDDAHHPRRLATWLRPLRRRSFLKFLLFGASFNGIVQLAGPYFSYWFTGELAIPMREVAIWGTLANVGNLVAALYWGKRIDQTKRAVPVIALSCFLIVLSPVPYIIPGADTIRLFAPFEFVINGAAWAGYQIGMTFLLFQATSSDPKQSAIEFSLYSAASGLVGAFCALLGGQLVPFLASLGGFRALWVLGSLARLIVLGVGLKWLLRDGVQTPAT